MSVLSGAPRTLARTAVCKFLWADLGCLRLRVPEKHRLQDAGNWQAESFREDWSYGTLWHKRYVNY